MEELYSESSTSVILGRDAVIPHFSQEVKFLICGRHCPCMEDISTGSMTSREPEASGESNVEKESHN